MVLMMAALPLVGEVYCRALKKYDKGRGYTLTCENICVEFVVCFKLDSWLVSLLVCLLI